MLGSKSINFFYEIHFADSVSKNNRLLSSISKGNFKATLSLLSDPTENKTKGFFNYTF